MRTANDTMFPAPLLAAMPLLLIVSAAAAAAATATAAAPAPATAPAGGEVLVYWAGDFGRSLKPVWVVQPGGAAGGTLVMLRDELADTNWKSLSALPQRTVAISGKGTELVLLLESDKGPRQWALYSPASGPGRTERFSYGAALPGGAAILAIAGDASTLWALGEGSAARPSSSPSPPPPPASAAAATPAGTRPSTLPAVEAAPPATRPGSAPATAPAAALPILYRFTAGGWSAVAPPLPEPVAADGVSMAVVKGVPFVAILSRPAGAAGDVIRLWRYDAGAKAWANVVAERTGNPSIVLTSGRGASDFSGRVRDFKVLNHAGEAAVWIWPEQSEGLGVIWTGADRGRANPIDLPAANANVAPSDIDLTSTGEQFWAVYRSPVDKKTYLQRYTPTGVPDGQPTVLMWVAPRTHSFDWLTIGVMAILTLLILFTLLRKRPVVASREDRADPED